MDKHEIIKKLDQDFTWTKDPIYEHFMFHKTEKVEGDCDDFSLTALYRLEGSVWKSLKALLTGKAKLIHCDTYWGEPHFALWYEGQYVDNIYPYWRDDLKHTYNYTYWFIAILFWLFVGKIYKR
jgi:hypothetical protein